MLIVEVAQIAWVSGRPAAAGTASVMALIAVVLIVTPVGLALARVRRG